MNNEFTRTRMLLGQEGLDKLNNATVMVLGVGGVGSHCIEALARGGIGKLILVDNDTIGITNINRQSIAYHSTIGKYKTKVMEQRINDISPNTRVLTHELFIMPDNADEIITPQIDYIVDAIDTVTAKLSVIELADKLNIPIISSMGTGNKLCPELFEIADIYDTSVDPLSRVMRRELKARGISNLKVVYSKEKPISVEGRVPGSVSFVPPVAGLLIAGEVIKDILEDIH